MSITAVILCGGQGTRLRSVIGDLPKCLAPVAGKPFLCYVLDRLHATRIEKVVLCTGYKSKEVEDFFGPDYAGLPLVYSHETEPLGTGGALRNALPLLDSDPVLVLNGDTFCKFDLVKLLKSHRSSGSSLAVTSLHYRNDPMGRPAGVWLIDHEIIRDSNRAVDLQNILDGVQVCSHLDYSWLLCNGEYPFHDIGTPEGYAGAKEFLRQQGVIT